MFRPKFLALLEDNEIVKRLERANGDLVVIGRLQDITRGAASAPELIESSREALEWITASAWLAERYGLCIAFRQDKAGTWCVVAHRPEPGYGE